MFDERDSSYASLKDLGISWESTRAQILELQLDPAFADPKIRQAVDQLRLDKPRLLVDLFHPDEAEARLLAGLRGFERAFRRAIRRDAAEGGEP